MGAFQGTLNRNVIQSAIFNMIISQDVFSDNIAGTFASLSDKATVDGTLYGDTKLYYATKELRTYPWANDNEAGNLLSLDRAPAPSVQAIVINVFRQIRLTTDMYLSKQAFSTEGAFGQYQSVMMGWMNDTKRIYKSTTYNAFFGTSKGSAAKSLIEVPLSDITDTGEEKKRAEASMIAQYLSDLFIEMKDVSRDFNDYGYLRSYNMDSIKVIWNSKFVNKIKKVDLPTMFHKDGLIDKFEEEILPSRYFGEVNASPTAGTAGGTVRSLVEQDIGANHYFAGDPIKTSDTAPANTSYTVDEDVICKIVTKLPPFMGAFSVGTSFFNPRSLTENHYLTFGHNTLEYLKAYPMITVHAD